MKVTKLNINKSDNEKKIKEKNTVYYKSRFNFLSQHNGIRPNKMHLFVAPTHVGKSTLINAIVHDLIERNEDVKVLLYLTEETVSDFESAISRFVNNYDRINMQLDVLVEDRSRSDDGIKDSIETAVFHNGYDLMFIDNLTTSKLYMDRSTETQASVSNWLKSLVKDVAIFIIAHTNGNNYNSQILDETHIRGSKSITNMTEFLYVMQPVRINNSLFQFIRIIKHRDQSPEDKFFRLNYDKKAKTISHDSACSFDDFKSNFKLRNSL